MKRRISVLIASLFVVGALMSAAPVQAAPVQTAAAPCADPHCPWSPVTMFVKDTLYWVKYNCYRTIDNCPL